MRFVRARHFRAAVADDRPNLDQRRPAFVLLRQLDDSGDLFDVVAVLHPGPGELALVAGGEDHAAVVGCPPAGRYLQQDRAPGEHDPLRLNQPGIGEERRGD